MRSHRVVRTSSAAARARRQRRGLSVIYFVFLLVAIVGFVSMAVDIGRIRLARNELQVAADASARAGADSLPIGTEATIDNACDTAESNSVIDAETSNAAHRGERTNPGVVLVPAEDLELGIWDKTNRTFTVLVDDGGTVNDERRQANAVHVTGRRITERDNPVPLIFAPVLGVFSSDIERQAIAYVTGGPDKFGFVGLDGVRSNGNKADLDSVLLPSRTRRYNGWLGSNGDIDMGNGDVYGDARAGIGKTISQSPNSVITGWAADLTEPLSYAMPTVPAKTLTFKGEKDPDPLKDGKYFKLIGDKKSTAANPTAFLGQFTVNPKEIKVTGYVALYLHGDLNLKDTIFTLDKGLPSQLTIYMLDKGSQLDVGGSGLAYAHIYAPQTDIKIHGGPGFFGWMIGKSLSFLGNTNLHYDESRNNSVPYKITLVK